MIKASTSKVEEQLAKFKLEVERKLKHMVTKFAYEIAQTAIENTPLGDSITYVRYYKARTDLPQVEGIARGNWQFSFDRNAGVQIIAGQASGEAALDVFEAKSGAYKLGQTFYILNAAPYIGALEADSSPQTNGMGIVKPTINTVMSAYKINLQEYYKQG